MKKLLTIALAVLLVMTAVSSMAIVVGNTSADGNKVQFDSISISTDKAMADYALVGTSVIADPAGTYSGDQMIFGVLKFTFDDSRSDQNDADIKVHITSDYVTFPMWLNQGYTTLAGGSTSALVGPARAHYLDKNGILNTFPISLFNSSYTVSPFTIEADTTNEEFVVTFKAKDNVGAPNNTFAADKAIGYGVTTTSGGPGGGGAYAFFTNKNDPSQPSTLSKVNGYYQTSMYIGFNGIVKSSTSQQGIIKAYISSGGSDKFVATQVAVDAGEFGVKVWTASSGDVVAAPYIDKYKSGKKAYRVYKLYGTKGNDPFTTAPLKYMAEVSGVTPSTEDYQAYEYLVQPFVNDEELQGWAIGFQNAAYQTGANSTAARFGKFTYREGLNTDPDNRGANVSPSLFKNTGAAATSTVPDTANLANFSLLTNAWDTGVNTIANTVVDALPTNLLAVNQLYTSGAMRLRDDATGKYYKFFKIVEGGSILDSQIKIGNELDSKVDPIMEFFGFSYDYINATKDEHYVGGGWKDYKETTFNYFGAVVPTDDDDVIPAETGDASMMIVIILAASALMAAAALFFVMKKARD